MNKKEIIKILFIILIVSIFITLFPSSLVFAVGEHEVTGADGKTYTYSDTDDGTDGPDVKGLRFELTGFGGNTLATGLTDESFTENSKYGWREYEKDGKKYVVLCGATHEMLAYSANRDDKYWFYGKKFDHIHYFHHYDTIQFKFEDQSFDSEVYNGMILESGDAMMFPQADIYKRETDINMFDVYFGTNGQSDPRVNTISGKVVIATMDGTFSQTSGSSSSSTNRNWILELLGAMFSLPADFINIGLNMPQKWGKYSILNAYDKTYIDDHKKIAKKLDVSESTTEEGASNSSDKILKVTNISNTIDNRKGEKTVVFSSSTQIPYMPIDAYSMVIGKVKTFDIGFFSNSKTNSSLKKVVKAGSHVVLYISAAALLTMIIWRGILVVMSTLGQNPVQATESRMIIDNAVKAIALLAGIYVIIILMQEGYTLLSNALLNGNKEEFPIRMNVEGVCSFNTNLIGYFKYLSLSSDSLAGLAYSMAYLGMSLISLTCFVFMLARTLIVAALTIFAPVTAIYAIAQRTPTSEASLGNVFILRNFLGLLFRWIYAPIITIAIIKFMFYVL